VVRRPKTTTKSIEKESPKENFPLHNFTPMWRLSFKNTEENTKSVEKIKPVSPQSYHYNSSTDADSSDEFSNELIEKENETKRQLWHYDSLDPKDRALLKNEIASEGSFYFGFLVCPWKIWLATQLYGDKSPKDFSGFSYVWRISIWWSGQSITLVLLIIELAIFAVLVYIIVQIAYCFFIFYGLKSILEK